MNKLISRLMIFAILLGAISFSSCDKEESAVNESKILIEYLESTVNPVSMGVIKTADKVQPDLVTEDVYVIDIRAKEAFDAGHVPGAVNVPTNQLLDHFANTDLSSYEYSALVCVTGQEAAWAATLLRMAGYPDVYSMKWGMCSWHADFAGAWNGNISSQYYPDYVTTATDKGSKGALPKLSTGESEAENILSKQIDAIFAEGIGKSLILSKNLMPDPSQYYIVNYWPKEQYDDPGHIEGAMQYTPKASLTLDTDLETLPADKTVVVYCHSGQNSAFLVAYLRTIGYDALSLKFGTNGQIYDQMPVSKWNPDAHVMNYEYDVTD